MNISSSDSVTVDLSEYMGDYKYLYRNNHRPGVQVSLASFCFNLTAIAKLDGVEFITLLVNPDEKELSIRPAQRKDRSSVRWIRFQDDLIVPKDVRAPLFLDKLYHMMGWDTSADYIIFGRQVWMGNGPIQLFKLKDAEVITPEIRQVLFPGNSITSFGLPLFVTKKIRSSKR